MLSQQNYWRTLRALRVFAVNWGRALPRRREDTNNRQFLAAGLPPGSSLVSSNNKIPMFVTTEGTETDLGGCPLSPVQLRALRGEREVDRSPPFSLPNRPAKLRGWRATPPSAEQAKRTLPSPAPSPPPHAPARPRGL